MTAPARRADDGFTLIELLVVLSIIVVVITLLIPSFTSILRASRITNATALILDEMNLARQTAIARNRVVELRFYWKADEANPTMAYRATRSMISDESGNIMTAQGQ